MGLIKKLFSFHISDIAGIIVGIILIKKEDTFGSFFDVLMSYWLYVFVCLAVFLTNLWKWFLEYRGETAYLKGVVGDILIDCVCITLATVSTVGVYSLFISIN